MSRIKEIRLVSSLIKIYDEDTMPQESLEGFSLLKNERKSLQLVVEAAEDVGAELTFKGTLAEPDITVVRHIRSDLPMNSGADDYYRFSKSGYYPDLLLPVSGKLLELKKGINAFWLEINAEGQAPGKYCLELTVDEKSVSCEIEIIDAALDFGDFIYTNWFHTDCLMSHYNVEVFSDEYWRITENFLKTAAEYGMNCVLTPIFTPPLDTEEGTERPTVQLVDIEYNNGRYTFGFDKLTKWISMAHRCGVEYFELAHFYTQWGAKHAPKIMAEVDGEYKRIFGWETSSTSKEYKEFLKAFSDSLKEYFESRGMKDKVLIHVSDEPNFWGGFLYSRASKYIHKLFKGYKIVDALSDYLFYKLKIVSTPIPANNHIDKFLGKVDNLWVYYCSGQKDHYVSNRFFCNCSLRTRVIGYQMFKYDIKGFLQWGYNFYYTCLSKAVINPFEVSDAGNSFPSGDSFIVYPADDGTAYHSLRLRVFYDALQDMAALNTLKKLSDKKTCLDIIEQKGAYSITFREYPHEDRWLLETREKVNKKIKELI